MNTRKEIKEYFEKTDVCKTVLSTATPNYSLAVEVWVDTTDNSVVYAVTDNIEFCYGMYNDFNDAVDEYFNRKEKLEAVEW